MSLIQRMPEQTSLNSNSSESQNQPSSRIGWVGPTEGKWNWIRSHLNRLETIDPADLREWKKRNEKGLILVATDARYSDFNETLRAELELEAELTQTTKTVSRSNSKRKKKEEDSSNPNAMRRIQSKHCILLGEDWSGHRRTLPFPDSTATFYWYQLYDRILPVLDFWKSYCHSEKELSEASELKYLLSPILNPPRTVHAERVLELQAIVPSPCQLNGARILVIADCWPTRTLWSQLLERASANGIVTSVDEWRFHFEPDCVIVDLSEEVANKSHNPQRATQILEKIRDRFPDSRIALIASFPRWFQWENWLSHGADAVFGKPFSWEGMGWTIRRWKEMDAASTIEG